MHGFDHLLNECPRIDQSHYFNLPMSIASKKTIIVMAGCLLYLYACKKNGQQTPVTITTVTPLTGPYSTIVTIDGSGFSPNATDNQVQFNKVDAVVQKASATELTVVVPKTAGIGAVTVRTGGQTATGPVFNYVYTVTVSTLAGSGTNGSADGTPGQFFYPSADACDGEGNVYVADTYNNSIRKITPAGVVSTLAGGAQGFVDGNGTAAKFSSPTGVACDGQGNIYVADAGNNSIRMITPAGAVSTLAGNGKQGLVNGTGAAALFFEPTGIACDGQGNIYVADERNNCVRKITPAGVVSTLAGSGAPGFANGNGTAALFFYPAGIACDGQGNIYVADQFNQRIRVITPSGTVSTLAGSGAVGFADGDGTTAQFNNPSDVASDGQGNIYVADIANRRIRKITPAGMVSTLAGNGTAGYFDGDGTAALFNGPAGVAVDAKGNIYVADRLNVRIRKITVE